MRKFVIGVATLVASLFVFAVPAFASGIQYYGDMMPLTASDAATAAGFLGIGTVVWLICLCCFPFILGLVLGYVAYADAKKNNIENPILWGLLSFFLPVVGLLIYLLVIKPDAMHKMQGGAMPHHAEMSEPKSEKEEDKKSE